MTNFEALSVLWASGLSGAKIAARLGGGATRNSVIGKAYRLGLPKRDTTSRLSQAVKRMRARRQRPAPAKPLSPIQALLALVEPTPPDADLVSKSVHLLDLEATSCHWPRHRDERNDWRFCGHERVVGLSYCRHHARRAFQATATVAPTPTVTSAVTAVPEVVSA
jgi:GcrA cell cycle regulator